MEKHFCLTADLLLQAQTNFFKRQLSTKWLLKSQQGKRFPHYHIIASTAFLCQIFPFMVCLSPRHRFPADTLSWTKDSEMQVGHMEHTSLSKVSLTLLHTFLVNKQISKQKILYSNSPSPISGSKSQSRSIDTNVQTCCNLDHHNWNWWFTEGLTFVLKHNYLKHKNIGHMSLQIYDSVHYVQENGFLAFSRAANGVLSIQMQGRYRVWKCSASWDLPWNTALL